MMEALWQDLRYGARMLRKKPSFTLIAVVTLALGIGANTAIFSVVNAVLLRPLPYPSSSRLVLVKESLPKLGWSLLATSPAEFQDYRENNQVFSELAAFTDLSVNLTGEGEPQRIQTARVSGNLFSLLGVQSLYGHTFSNEEDQVGKNNVVVLSFGLWLRHFGGDSAAIGKVVRLDDRPYTVVGVMPPRFEFPYIWTSFADRAEMWIPLALTDREKSNRASSFEYGAIGRLKPGVTLAQAQSDLEAVATRMQQQYPDLYSQTQVSVTAVGLEEDVVKKIRPLLLLLTGAVGMVLLIACANVANLLLVRSTARQKEIGIRGALGAGTARLVQQLLTEAVLLALIGGSSGLLLAIWAVDLIKKYGPSGVPRLQSANLDPSVLGFTLLTSLLTALLFGLAPALQCSRFNLNEVLKDASGRASQGREGKHLRRLLVVFETAAAVVLLIGGGLLIRSFIQVLTVPSGFNPSGVVIARTALPVTRYPKTEQSKAAQKQILERLAALPGVEVAGETTHLPLAGDRNIGFQIEGDENSFKTAYNAIVSDDYFRAMGIPLRTGRGFTSEDRENTTPVVVVNETMARRFWPDGNAIRKRLRWGGWPGAWLAIVGIVADSKGSSLEAETTPAIYMSLSQIPRAWSTVNYVVRTAHDPAALVPAIRGEIRAVDAELPVFNIQTMNQVMAESIAQRWFSMSLLVVLASAALFLAAIGLYGVLSYSVTQRTNEIGIRMALGARGGDILKLVVQQGLTLTSTGLALGLIIACFVTRLMTSLLFGVSATDPTTFAVVASLLAVVALAACYLPARRATRVDPIVALRYE